eukprot:158985-Rhodomonas_salina.4
MRQKTGHRPDLNRTLDFAHARRESAKTPMPTITSSKPHGFGHHQDSMSVDTIKAARLWTPSRQHVSGRRRTGCRPQPCTRARSSRSA